MGMYSLTEKIQISDIYNVVDINNFLIDNAVVSLLFWGINFGGLNKNHSFKVT